MQIISELVETCRNHDFTDIVVVHEHRGEPDGMVVCHLPFGPTAFFGVYNTVSAPSPSCPECLVILLFRAYWGKLLSMHFQCLQYFTDAASEDAALTQSECHSCARQVLRHDIGEKKKVGTISEAYPHLIINNFTSRLGQRVGNILKFLFPCPKVCSSVANPCMQLGQQFFVPRELDIPCKICTGV